MKYLVVLALAALAAASAFGNNSSTSLCGIDQGAARMFCASGGALDLETTGLFQIQETPVQNSAAEMNLLHEYAQGAPATGVVKYARGFYDFHASGGQVGTSTIGITLPTGALVIGGYLDIDGLSGITGPTGNSGATIALQIQSANDLLVAHSINNNYFTGTMALVPTGSAATAIKLTGPGVGKVVVGSTTVNYGVMNVFVEYLLSQ